MMHYTNAVLSILIKLLDGEYTEARADLMRLEAMTHFAPITDADRRALDALRREAELQIVVEGA